MTFKKGQRNEGFDQAEDSPSYFLSSQKCPPANLAPVRLFPRLELRIARFAETHFWELKK